LLYFEGALADAPASARSNVRSDPETASAAIMTTRHLDIASSIWFGTTQTKQNVDHRQKQIAKNRLSNKTDRQTKQTVKQNRLGVPSLHGCCPAVQT
jgi:hypothetical protein